MVIIPFPKTWSEYDANTLKHILMFLNDCGFSNEYISGLVINGFDLDDFKNHYIEIVGVWKSNTHLFDTILNNILTVVQLIESLMVGYNINTTYRYIYVLHNGVLFINEKRRDHFTIRRDKAKYNTK